MYLLPPSFSLPKTVSDTKQRKRRPGARNHPTKKSPFIVEKEGFLVYTGPVHGDLTRAIEEDREERDRVVAGEQNR